MAGNENVKTASRSSSISLSAKIDSSILVHEVVWLVKLRIEQAIRMLELALLAQENDTGIISHLSGPLFLTEMFAFRNFVFARSHTFREGNKKIRKISSVIFSG
jgi:hypothetical protein